MKVFIFKKSSLISFLCYVLLILTVALFSADRVQTAMSVPDKVLPIYSVKTNKKQLAITFDAAWGADDTDEIIAILKKHNAKATFFIVGEWAEKYPESVKAFYDNGHSVAGHSYNHTLYTNLNSNELTDDLAKCNEILASVTNEWPSIVRVPSGDYDERVIKTIYSVGLYPIQWDVDSLDYTGISKDEIVSRVTSKVKNGSIVLFHNDVENTPAALDEILTKLAADGWQFVTVDELIIKENFSLNHEGRQFSTKN